MTPMLPDASSFIFFFIEIFITGIIFIAPLFQILKIFKEKSSKGVSLFTWICFLLAGVGMLAYDLYTYTLTAGISSNLNSVPFISIFILENSTIIYLVSKYKKTDK